MLQRQQLTAFISLVDTQVVRLHTHPRLPSTKKTIGKLLVTWLKLDGNMVRSPQDLQQWLLVVIHIVDQRKLIFERNIINCFLVCLPSYGTWIFLKTKSSIQPCQQVTECLAYFWSTLDSAPKTTEEEPNSQCK